MNRPPKKERNVHVQSLELCEYITLYDKKDFAAMIKLTTLKLSYYLLGPM